MSRLAGDIPWQAPIHFDGTTYAPQRDLHRLHGQLLRVKDILQDGRWRTIQEITEQVGGTTQSVSARIRDLRKPRFGSHTVERKSLGGGLFAYRLVK